MNHILELWGVQIITDVQLIEICEDEHEGLETVVFKMLNMPDVEDDEEEDEILGDEEKSEGEKSGSQVAGTGEDPSQGDDEAELEAELNNKKKKRKKNEKEIDCRVLITAGHRDVDQDVFHSIHNNGLVYNGRLIVDKNF